LQRKAGEAGISLPELLTADNLLSLNTPEDTEILKHLDAFPENLRNAAEDFAPCYISHYLITLAGMVHRYYTMHQVITVPNSELAMSRLALLSSAGQVLHNGLELLGVTAPESM
jgi:arginyl-tRNA synthetase